MPSRHCFRRLATLGEILGGALGTDLELRPQRAAQLEALFWFPGHGTPGGSHRPNQLRVAIRSPQPVTPMCAG